MLEPWLRDTPVGMRHWWCVCVRGGGSVSHPASPFMSPPLPLTRLCCVCKQTGSARLAQRRGSRRGRGPALECAAGSAGRAAAWPNYPPISTTVPPHMLSFTNWQSLIKFTSDSDTCTEKKTKKTAFTCFVFLFFLHGSLFDARNKHVIQMQFHCCLAQIVALWFYFCVDIQTQES